MNKITDILKTMDYGVAPEAADIGDAWLAGHDRAFGHFIAGKFTRPKAAKKTEPAAPKPVKTAKATPDKKAAPKPVKGAPQGLRLAAVLRPGAKPLAHGPLWFLYALDGAREVARSAHPQPVLPAPPGRYRLQVRLGTLTHSQEVRVRKGVLTKATISLNAGIIHRASPVAATLGAWSGRSKAVTARNSPSHPQARHGSPWVRGFMFLSRGAAAMRLAWP